MISYKRLWKTLKAKGLNKQYLVDELGFSKGLMDNLLHNRSITMNTLNDICEKLNITPDQVIEYTKSNNKYDDNDIK